MAQLPIETFYEYIINNLVTQLTSLLQGHHSINKLVIMTTVDNGSVHETERSPSAVLQ